MQKCKQIQEEKKCAKKIMQNKQKMLKSKDNAKYAKIAKYAKMQKKTNNTKNVQQDKI